MKQSEALDTITKIRLAHQAMESACKRIDELKEENKNLTEALAQSRSDVKQEQGEPVAYLAWKDEKPCYEGDDAVCEDAVWPVDGDDDRTSMPVYTTPQQRTAAEGEDTRRAWVELTDEEIRACIASNKYAFEIVRAAESKLREKNSL